MPNHMMCKKRLALLLKKVEGDLDDALLVGLVDGKQEFLFSFFITLGFPHFVSSYFKVHF